MLKDLCFEIIQTCPNECKFCSSNSSKDKRTIISLEQFKKTITYFINNGGIEEVSISGGEPFFHPDLFEMIKFCKECGIRTVLFTSGIKRTSEMPAEIIRDIENKCKDDLEKIEKNEPWNQRLKLNVKAYYNKLINPKEYSSIQRTDFEKLKKLGLDKIVFNCQTLNEDIDSELMGRDSLSICLIDSLIRARTIGLKVEVHFIPMKQNYREFLDIVECLEIAGINKISVLNFVPQGRGKENQEELMLNQEELKKFSEIIKKAKESYNVNIRIGIPLNKKISNFCNAGTEKLDIKYDGTILPCPAFKELSVETMEKYGIKLYSIYDDLENFALGNFNRKEPLCKQIYGLTGSLIDDDQEVEL